MLKQYLNLVFRNIFRQKTFSFINIFGLAIGITSAMVILLYVHYELSYNKHIGNAKNKYRIVEIQKAPGVGVQHVAVTMGPLAEALKNDFPEVKNSLRITEGGTLTLNCNNKNFNEKYTCFADTNVFDMLSIQLLRGNPDQVLSELNSVVLSEKLALKFYSTIDNAIGKVIDIADEPFFITGIMKNMKNSSHIFTELIMPMKIRDSRYDWMQSWRGNSLDTYIQLVDGTDQKILEGKLPEFIKKYTEESWKNGLEMYIQPILDIHLKSNHIKFEVFNHNQGDINQIYIFLVVASLILIVACINYINLATARAFKRAKEVGIRKTVGAQKSRIVFQFLGESFIVTFISTTIAIVLVELILPTISKFLDINLKLNFSSLMFYIVLLILILLLGLISGSYPAFYLSAFNPVKVLKGNTINIRSGSTGRLRKILVVLQFSISIIIIISTLVALGQMDYLRKKDKGYNDDSVYSIPFHRTNDIQRLQDMEIFKNELINNPNIQDIALSAGPTGVSGNQSAIYVADSSATRLVVRLGYVDENFFKLMEIPLTQGRFFSNDFPTDRDEAIILNENAVRKLGWLEPIGKEFKPRGGDSAANLKVVGVIKDYNYYSLLSPIEPAVYLFRPEGFHRLNLRVNPQNVETTLFFIEGRWNELFPKSQFEGYFMDDRFQYQYKNQINSMKVFAFFAIICIIISCLGLYGLVAYIVSQRTKEIAIRKALGSSVFQIVRLINLDFIKLILLSSIIAIPISLYYMLKWLNNFVYRIDLNWIYFAIAIIVALIIAFITNIIHITRAAHKNPADSLRYE